VRLSEKKRDDLKSLLEDHQKIVDGLKCVRRATWTSNLEVVHDNGQDSVMVPLRYELAEQVLNKQKQWVEKELAKLGVEIGQLYMSR
jgi:hypothetical protein